MANKPSITNQERHDRNFLSVMELRENFAEILSRAQIAEDRFRIVKHGKPVAAIIPIADLDWLEMLEDATDEREAELGRQEIERGESSTWEEVKAGLKL